jgi:hypothetical protein
MRDLVLQNQIILGTVNALEVAVVEAGVPSLPWTGDEGRR